MTDEQRFFYAEQEEYFKELGLIKGEYLFEKWCYYKLYQVEYCSNYWTGETIGLIDGIPCFVEIVNEGNASINYKLKCINKIHYTELNKYKKIIKVLEEKCKLN